MHGLARLFLVALVGANDFSLPARPLSCPEQPRATAVRNVSASTFVPTRAACVAASPSSFGWSTARSSVICARHAGEAGWLAACLNYFVAVVFCVLLLAVFRAPQSVFPRVAFHAAKWLRFESVRALTLLDWPRFVRSGRFLFTVTPSSVPLLGVAPEGPPGRSRRGKSALSPFRRPTTTRSTTWPRPGQRRGVKTD